MLGEPVVHCLQADGYRVRVLTRNPDKARAIFGDGVEAIKGDVEDANSLDTALRGCVGVHINLYGGFDADLERRGTTNVAQAACRANVMRLTYLSGASVFAENCWYAGTRARFEAEAAIRASGVPYTIFKATHFMEPLHRFVRGKHALLIGKPPFAWHRLAAEDYARMVAKAYATPAADKSLFVYGPQALMMRDALHIFCRTGHPDARLMFFTYCIAARHEAHDDLAQRAGLRSRPALDYRQWLVGKPERLSHTGSFGFSRAMAHLRRDAEPRRCREAIATVPNP